LLSQANISRVVMPSLLGSIRVADELVRLAMLVYRRICTIDIVEVTTTRKTMLGRHSIMWWIVLVLMGNTILITKRGGATLVA
jgi:hypothetical protein